MLCLDRPASVHRAAVRQLQDESDSEGEEVEQETADAAGADALAAVWLASGAGVRQTLLNGLKCKGACSHSHPSMPMGRPLWVHSCHADTVGIESSCKTLFVVALLRKLVPAGHRVLLFSQSTRMLDILQAAVEGEGLTWLRVDGSVTSAAEREVGFGGWDLHQRVSSQCRARSTEITRHAAQHMMHDRASTAAGAAVSKGRLGVGVSVDHGRGRGRLDVDRSRPRRHR